MGIKPLVLFSALVVLIPLLTIHCKQTPVCPKEGYVFTYINSKSFYNPSSDSIPLGDSIVLTATLPAGFVDETTHKTVYNLSSVAEGPLHIVMLQPNLQGGADYFTIKAETGHIFSDSVHFSANALKGFRTLQWAAFSDSFKIKLIIKPLVKGTFEIALG